MLSNTDVAEQVVSVLQREGQDLPDRCQYTYSTTFIPVSADVSKQMGKDVVRVSSCVALLITYSKADPVSATWMLVILTLPSISVSDGNES